MSPGFRRVSAGHRRNGLRGDEQLFRQCVCWLEIGCGVALARRGNSRCQRAEDFAAALRGAPACPCLFWQGQVNDARLMVAARRVTVGRSEEDTAELPALKRRSYGVFW